MGGPRSGVGAPRRATGAIVGKITLAGRSSLMRPSSEVAAPGWLDEKHGARMMKENQRQNAAGWEKTAVEVGGSGLAACVLGILSGVDPNL